MLRSLQFVTAIVFLFSGGLLSAAAADGAPEIPLSVSTSNSGFNRLLVTVKVCVPGTQKCTTIPNIMVDTGSTGLRLQAFALSSSSQLPALIGGDGKPAAECEHFGGSNAWGTIHRIDLYLPGAVARDLPVQVVDANERNRPEDCPASTGAATSNGTLGIGWHETECEGECMNSARSPRFYSCGAEACQPIRGQVPAANILPNPITKFGDGTLNGYILELPQPGANGAREVRGRMVLGVGTAANNQLPSEAFPLPPGGYFPVTYRGRTYPRSYIDSGTPTYVLPDSDYPLCAHPSWAICTSSEQHDTAEMQDGTGQTHPLAFLVGNYEKQRDGGNGASRNAATSAKQGATGMSFGAPFFLGKRVALVLEGHKVPGHPELTGPLYAWQAASLR